MFKGSYVALITPFDGEQVDEDALVRLIEWHIERGTHGLVPVGTTGESPTLTHDEHKRVVELTVKTVAGRIPVIAGAGSNSVFEAIDFSRHAEKAGANALLHVAGYYNRPNQEGMYQHFKTVHDACNLPIVIYNIPPRCVVGVDVDTLTRLAELPRIVGAKDATTDLSRPGRERIRIRKEFTWLSGEDATAVAYNASGGNGCISVSANVAPAECAKMQTACLAGDYATALEYQDLLMPLHEALFAEPSPAGVKYAVSLLGLCGDACRLPLVPLTDATKERIENTMRDIGLIES
ncbi:MAG: 4-hydroxy-tetrahydrodipicolinate synthase [Proteobacteria bacterium]|nr:MAG: 4-hydroxy-tetrahydrodipicolinate synthase [Pseudomonadota bacterium]